MLTVCRCYPETGHVPPLTLPFLLRHAACPRAGAGRFKLKSQFFTSRKRHLVRHLTSVRVGASFAGVRSPV
jgi:hypothetical protein